MCQVTGTRSNGVRSWQSRGQPETGSWCQGYREGKAGMPWKSSTWETQGLGASWEEGSAEAWNPGWGSWPAMERVTVAEARSLPCGKGQMVHVGNAVAKGEDCSFSSVPPWPCAVPLELWSWQGVRGWMSVVQGLEQCTFEEAVWGCTGRAFLLILFWSFEHWEKGRRIWGWDWGMSLHVLKSFVC